MHSIKYSFISFMCVCYKIVLNCMKRYFLYSIILFGTIGSKLFSQDFKVQRITIDQGLVNNVVKCIYQDSKGFLYIGTQDGLCKYDGYAFKEIESNINDTTSISSNNICSLLEDSKGRFWIGTLNNGINLLDRTTGKCKRYMYGNTLNNNSVISLYEDKQGTIWLYDGSLYTYHPLSDKFEVFNLKLNISNLTVRFFYEDYDHQFWIGTNDGLIQYDRKTGQFKIYKIDSQTKDSSSNAVLSISEETNGNFYIGTFKGLYRFHKNSGKYFKIEACSKSFEFDKEIYTIKNKGQYLWLAWQTIGNRFIGISKFDKKNNKCLDYTFGDSTVGVSEFVPVSMYEDRSGVLWVGTFLGGLIKVEKNTLFHTQLNNKIINAFMESKDGKLWLSATNNYLYWFDQRKSQYHEIRNIFNNHHSLDDNSILSIFQDHKGTVWMGTKSGELYHYRNLTGSCNYGCCEQELKGAIKTITEDANHHIWIGVENKGLYYYDPESKKLIFFCKNQSNTNSISNNSIETILADSANDELWVGTWNGLNRLIMPKNKPITQDNVVFQSFYFNPKDTNSLNDNRVISLCMSHSGILWVGTAGGGLQKIEYEHYAPFNKVNYTISRYTVEKGLPNNVVYGILEDHHGFLWISTNKGLAKFNPLDKTFINFDTNDGLKSSQFFWRSYYKSPSGKMYFGSINGYYSFYPDSIKVNQYIPPVYITGFSIFNKLQEPGIKGSPLKLKIEYTPKISINYNQSVLSFDFVALNFISPQKNMYAYRLVGFDKDWQQVGYQRKATYTNLDPGTYVFQVIASNNNGIWNTSGTSLIIEIRPPFWKTLWFRIMAVLIFIIAILIYIRFRTYKLQSQNILLENKVKERTVSLVEINTLLEENQEEISMQKEELITQRDNLENANKMLLEQKMKIEEQNEELHLHRTQLEALVESRTIELENALYKSKESDRLKSSFLANMSHEIRTPMNAILGFSSLLTNENLTEYERNEYIHVITSSGESLMVLINDILDLSLIQSNQLSLNPTRINLQEVFTDIYDSFSLEANKRRINLSFTMNAVPPNFLMETDVIRLKQVFNNLVSNALKFTERGTVEFGVFSIGNEITFYIKDTGIGIAKGNENSIFDRFFKIENDKNVIYGGTGLGLSICKLLIELWGGKIWYESTLGVGTTFYFTHPLGKPEYKQIKINENNLNNKDLPDLRGKIILIAEDMESNFKLLKALLADSNVMIIWKKTGKEVIEYIQEYDVDLILMDIKMPVMDGNETTKIVKSMKPYIPIIAQTAFAFENEVRTMLLSGFNDYLVKPIKKMELIHVLWKYLV